MNIHKAKNIINKEIEGPKPELFWFESQEIDGECGENSITIWAGKDESDHLPALLHEIAHFIRRGGRHNDELFREVQRLYQKYGVNYEKAMEIEEIKPQWFFEERW